MDKETIKQLLADGVISNEVAAKYFPELKESEDERIRIELLNYLYDVHDDDEERARWIAWLEKQGEQKDILEDATLDNNEDGLIADTIKAKGEQNPAWSEEDEAALGDALWCCKQAASLAKDENDMGNIWYAENWLKSLKDRVQLQPVQEWNGGDDAHIHSIITHLQDFIESHPNTTGADIQRENVAWLKSLRLQSQWKPSDEQMIAINTAINVIGKGTLNGKQLIELQEALKKLKG